jgi:hypothetical protein
MKKIDIEKQLAEHPNTVFRIDRSNYLITRIVQEKNEWKRYANPTWRVYVKFVGLHKANNTLRVGDEYSYSYPLGKVDFARWDTLELAHTALVAEQLAENESERQKQDRTDRFTDLRHELMQLGEVADFERLWVDDPWGRDEIKITMKFNDAYKLIALMQASLNTEATA